MKAGGNRQMSGACTVWKLCTYRKSSAEGLYRQTTLWYTNTLREY
jgi:hypothetical protein